ncbi:MAG: PKD domain-containing protein [Bacteroidia bacterium]
MKKNIITLILLLATVKIYAQPANDDCQYSQAIQIPQSGSICFTTTNTGATPDAVAPNGCNGPTGGNEVWFSYIVTGTQNSITVNPSGGTPAQFVAITVPNGGCGSAVPLICNAAAAAGGPAFVNFSLPVGTQVWFEVTALGADGGFDICINSVSNVPSYSASVGDSCFTAIRLCNKQSFTGTPPFPIFSNSGQQISCYAFPAAYLSDIWYKFTVGKSGTLGWICTPQLGLDIDWEVLDITAGCPGLLPALCCNNIYNGAGGDPTGMDASSGTPCGGASHIVTPVNVVAGNTYAIHLNYTNASLNTFTMTFSGTFEIAPFPDFTVDNPTGCAPLVTDFTDASFAASSYNWSFGNGNTFVGSNPAPQNYAVSGNYLVGLTVNNAATGCVNATSQTVTIDAAQTSTFTASPATVCVNSNTTITYTGTGSASATYNWNFNGGTVMSGSGQGPYDVQWATAGTKTVTLTVTQNGCTSTATNVNITVNAPPSTTFNMPANACTGDTILINYSGTNASSFAQYYWNFSNSFLISTNGTDTFYVVWNNPGLDSVNLQIDDQGCLSTPPGTTHYITITTRPTSTFTLTDTICSSQQAIAVYTGTGAGSATYNWNFGTGVAVPGGTVAGPQNITYATPGYHNISLIVNEAGCLSAASDDSVFVVYAPTSTFTVSDDSLCGNETAVITYTGTGTGAAVFNWNFNAANIISGSGTGPYTIDYPAAGLNYITLDVSENGCTSLIKKDSIVIADVPVANAGTDVTYCAGDSALVGTVAVVGYQYAWSPATGVNHPTFAIPYAIIGNTGTTVKSVDLILTVTNLFCVDKDTVNVKVYPKQNAVITVTPGLTQCLDVNHFNFTNNATTIPGGAFNWNFTPGASTVTATTSTVNNITYSTPGNYLVSLITSSANCPNDTDKVTLTINDVPHAGFFADTLIGCPPLTVNFTDTSTIVPGSTYFWDLGNGTTSTFAGDTAAEYTTGGSYNVSLTITSPAGCSSEASHNNLITVTDPPQASFIADPIVTTVLQPVINFTSTSTNTDTCLYLFGDGGTSSDCATKYAYSDTGTYLVTLIVSNAGGCSDTAYETVTVNDFYTLYFPNSFTPNRDGVNDLYSVTGFGVQTFKISIFNNHGQDIFEANNINFTWDGTDVNGDKVPEGYYVYKAEIRDVLGKKHEKTGGIVVLR